MDMDAQRNKKTGKNVKYEPFYFNLFIKALEEIPQTVIAGVDLSTANESQKEYVAQKVWDTAIEQKRARRKQLVYEAAKRFQERRKAAKKQESS